MRIYANICEYISQITLNYFCGTSCTKKAFIHVTYHIHQYFLIELIQKKTAAKEIDLP